MSDLNMVQVIGHLGADPEMKYTPSGDAVCNIRVATTDKWTDRNTGERKEKTEWHRIVFFSKLAEIAGEYLRKGGLVYVQGQLTTQKWQDQAGNDRYSTQIRGKQMQMLDKKPEGFQEPAQAPAQVAQPAPAAQGDDFDDDIPF